MTAKRTGSRRGYTIIQRKKIFMKALESSLGIVTQASNVTGIPRQNHYDWYGNDPDYRDAVDNMKDIRTDFVESALLKRVKEGGDAAIIFYLKTQARDRGYIERRDISLSATPVFTIDESQAALQSTIKRIEQTSQDADTVQDDQGV